MGLSHSVEAGPGHAVETDPTITRFTRPVELILNSELTSGMGLFDFGGVPDGGGDVAFGGVGVVVIVDGDAFSVGSLDGAGVADVPA